jgi:hypothetical protein
MINTNVIGIVPATILVFIMIIKKRGFDEGIDIMLKIYLILQGLSKAWILILHL